MVISNPLLDSTAVVTVTYNSSEALPGFLGSVHNSEDRQPLVIVADNHSSDANVTQAIAQAHGAEVLSLVKNVGYGGAINAAVATLPPSIDFVLISNPDVELRPGAITAMLDEISHDQLIGAIGPRVLNSDGTTYPSGRQLPSIRTGIGHAIFARSWPNNPWSRRYRADEEGSDTLRTVGWLSGSCLLVRRSAFEQLGGFDESFFMYFEDVDLGFRLRKAGWKNVYTPVASVVHTGAHSTSADLGKMVRIHHDSAYRYLEKKYPAPYMAPIRWGLRVGLAVRSYLYTRNSGAK